MLFQPNRFTFANHNPYCVQKPITDLERLVQAKAAEIDMLNHFLWDEAPTEVTT
jgi:hypothetical protein